MANPRAPKTKTHKPPHKAKPKKLAKGESIKRPGVNPATNPPHSDCHHIPRAM